MTSFEEKVYQLLADCGLSVQELAKQVDMPEPELRALCHRNDPRLSELERLARALRVPPPTSSTAPSTRPATTTPRKSKSAKPPPTR